MNTQFCSFYSLKYAFMSVNEACKDHKRQSRTHSQPVFVLREMMIKYGRKCNIREVCSGGHLKKEPLNQMGAQYLNRFITMVLQDLINHIRIPIMHKGILYVGAFAAVSMESLCLDILLYRNVCIQCPMDSEFMLVKMQSCVKDYPHHLAKRKKNTGEIPITE